jgi:hypothetical protein
MRRYVQVFDGAGHRGFTGRIVTHAHGRGLYVVRLDTMERTFVARSTWRTLWRLVP